MPLPNPLFHWSRSLRLFLLATMSCFLTVCVAIAHPWSTVQAIDAPVTQTVTSVDRSNIRTLEDGLQAGIQQFQAEDYEGARNTWQAALERSTEADDRLTLTLLLSNLSLAHQHLGFLEKADQYLSQSLELFEDRNTANRSLTEWEYYAKALNTKGWLEWRQGKTEAALETWKETTLAYEAADHIPGIIGSQINQAKALQSLGLSTQAKEQLETVRSLLDDLDASSASLKITGLRHLGNALRRVGELDKSETVLTDALSALKPIDVPAQNLASDLWLDMGNTLRSQWERAVALNLTEDMETYQQLTQDAYGQAIATADSDAQTVLTQTHQLAWLIARQEFEMDRPRSTDLSAQIRDAWTLLTPKFKQLPVSRFSLDIHLQAIDSAIAFNTIQGSSGRVQWDDLLAQLEQTDEQATALGDRRSQSLALGYKGAVYEHIAHDQNLPLTSGTWIEAENLTIRAITLSESIQAPDIQYRWEWQLGRLMRNTNPGRELCIHQPDPKQENNQDDVLCTYEQAINTLEKARQDLLSINSDVQFSFRDNVEPLYRQYVELLLQSHQYDPPQIKNKKLAKATQLIDALQLAELENFLGCNLNPIPLTEQVVDPHSAIVYPVILSDSLDVVLSLPEQDHSSEKSENSETSDNNRKQVFTHASSPISHQDLTSLLSKFRQELADPKSNRRSRITHEKQLYQLLIQPFEETLERRPEIETLVFVLDGDLRTIPMSTLRESQASNRYLIDRYAIAIAPSLQLVAPNPLRSPMKVLAAGSSEPMDHPFQEGKFIALPKVANELATIETLLPTDVLFNESFTKENLKQYIQTGDFSIVHLATHGTFSSEPSRTFIAIHDGKIDEGATNNSPGNDSPGNNSGQVAIRGDTLSESDVDKGSEKEGSDTALFANELDVLLRDRPNSSPFDNQELDLLVLSACETATGDNRATLGIAGLAIRAGARSTLATLWSVYDDAAAVLMQEFYQQLANNNSTQTDPVSRAKALRQAQITLKEQYPEWNHPSYWSPYILVGSWL